MCVTTLSLKYFYIMRSETVIERFLIWGMRGAKIRGWMGTGKGSLNEGESPKHSPPKRGATSTRGEDQNLHHRRDEPQGKKASIRVLTNVTVGERAQFEKETNGAPWLQATERGGGEKGDEQTIPQFHSPVMSNTDKVNRRLHCKIRKHVRSGRQRDHFREKSNKKPDASNSNQPDRGKSPSTR